MWLIAIVKSIGAFKVGESGDLDLKSGDSEQKMIPEVSHLWELSQHVPFYAIPYTFLGNFQSGVVVCLWIYQREKSIQGSVIIENYLTSWFIHEVQRWIHLDGFHGDITMLFAHFYQRIKIVWKVKYELRAHNVNSIKLVYFFGQFYV